MKLFKYEILDKRYPFDKGDWEVCSMHLKDILVKKTIFGITLSTKWYRQHINSEFEYWISVESYDKDWNKWKTLPRDIEDFQNRLFTIEFDNYHENRKANERDCIIDDLLR